MLVRGYFDREVKRLAYVNDRKSLHSKDKGKDTGKAADAGADSKKDAPPVAAAAKESEDTDEAFEKLYVQMEKTFLEAYGAR